jgi:hypothetical protein
MKVGEFARRARALRLNRSNRFDEAFKQLRQELQLTAAEPPAISRKSGVSGPRQSKRPTLTLFPKT